MTGALEDTDTSTLIEAVKRFIKTCADGLETATPVFASLLDCLWDDVPKNERLTLSEMAQSTPLHVLNVLFG